MNDSDMMRDIDRRHVIQAFDLFNESEFDTFEMIRLYSRSRSRKLADAGSEYFVLRQPVSSLQDLANGEAQIGRDGKVDPIILHWMADLYLYALYERGVPMEESVGLADPRWLYDRFSPLHEAGFSRAWAKVEQLRAV